MTVLQSAAAETNLPADCCDAIFMRLVYHHFGDPPAMNASLLRSLKPGGRLAVLEFRPTSGVTARRGSAPRATARGDASQVIEELTAAGFADVREVPWPSAPTFAVVARAERPGSDQRKSAGNCCSPQHRPMSAIGRGVPLVYGKGFCSWRLASRSVSPAVLIAATRHSSPPKSACPRRAVAYCADMRCSFQTCRPFLFSTGRPVSVSPDRQHILFTSLPTMNSVIQMVDRFFGS